MKRNAYFVNDTRRRRAFYIALVRSQFENCSIIWRPTTQSLTQKIESLQKRALKWILSEENHSYSSWPTYVSKCRQVKLLPMSARFELNDFLFLHKVIYNHIPVVLPVYLSFFQGQSRLRRSHLDNLSLVSSITPHSDNNTFANSFYYRTHCNWNRLPYNIREIVDHQQFKTKLTDHLWKDLMTDLEGGIEDEYDLMLDNG